MNRLTNLLKRICTIR